MRAYRERYSYYIRCGGGRGGSDRTWFCDLRLVSDVPLPVPLTQLTTPQCTVAVVVGIPYNPSNNSTLQSQYMHVPSAPPSSAVQGSLYTPLPQQASPQVMMQTTTTGSESFQHKVRYCL